MGLYINPFHGKCPNTTGVPFSVVPGPRLLTTDAIAPLLSSLTTNPLTTLVPCGLGCFDFGCVVWFVSIVCWQLDWCRLYSVSCCTLQAQRLCDSVRCHAPDNHSFQQTLLQLRKGTRIGKNRHYRVHLSKSLGVH